MSGVASSSSKSDYSDQNFLKILDYNIRLEKFEENDEIKNIFFKIVSSHENLDFKTYFLDNGVFDFRKVLIEFNDLVLNLNKLLYTVDISYIIKKIIKSPNFNVFIQPIMDENENYYFEPLYYFLNDELFKIIYDFIDDPKNDDYKSYSPEEKDFFIDYKLKEIIKYSNKKGNFEILKKKLENDKEKNNQKMYLEIIDFIQNTWFKCFYLTMFQIFLQKDADFQVQNDLFGLNFENQNISFFEIKNIISLMKICPNLKIINFYNIDFGGNNSSLVYLLKEWMYDPYLRNKEFFQLSFRMIDFNYREYTMMGIFLSVNPNLLSLMFNDCNYGHEYICCLKNGMNTDIVGFKTETIVNNCFYICFPPIIYVKNTDNNKIIAINQNTELIDRSIWDRVPDDSDPFSSEIIMKYISSFKNENTEMFYKYIRDDDQKKNNFLNVLTFNLSFNLIMKINKSKSLFNESLYELYQFLKSFKNIKSLDISGNRFLFYSNGKLKNQKETNLYHVLMLIEHSLLRLDLSYITSNINDNADIVLQILQNNLFKKKNEDFLFKKLKYLNISKLYGQKRLDYSRNDEINNLLTHFLLKRKSDIKIDCSTNLISLNNPVLLNILFEIIGSNRNVKEIILKDNFILIDKEKTSLKGDWIGLLIDTMILNSNIIDIDMEEWTLLDPKKHIFQNEGFQLKIEFENLLVPMGILKTFKIRDWIMNLNDIKKNEVIQNDLVDLSYPPNQNNDLVLKNVYLYNYLIDFFIKNYESNNIKDNQKIQIIIKNNDESQLFREYMKKMFNNEENSNIYSNDNSWINSLSLFLNNNLDPYFYFNLYNLSIQSDVSLNVENVINLFSLKSDKSMIFFPNLTILKLRPLFFYKNDYFYFNNVLNNIRKNKSYFKCLDFEIDDNVSTHYFEGLRNKVDFFKILSKFKYIEKLKLKSNSIFKNNEYNIRELFSYYLDNINIDFLSISGNFGLNNSFDFKRVFKFLKKNRKIINLRIRNNDFHIFFIFLKKNIIENVHLKKIILKYDTSDFEWDDESHVKEELKLFNLFLFNFVLEDIELSTKKKTEFPKKFDRITDRNKKIYQLMDQIGRNQELLDVNFFNFNILDNLKYSDYLVKNNIFNNNLDDLFVRTEIEDTIHYSVTGVSDFFNDQFLSIKKNEFKDTLNILPENPSFCEYFSRHFKFNNSIKKMMLIETRIVEENFYHLFDFLIFNDHLEFLSLMDCNFSKLSSYEDVNFRVEKDQYIDLEIFGYLLRENKTLKKFDIDFIHDNSSHLNRDWYLNEKEVHYHNQESFMNLILNNTSIISIKLYGVFPILDERYKERYEYLHEFIQYYLSRNIDFTFEKQFNESLKNNVPQASSSTMI